MANSSYQPLHAVDPNYQRRNSLLFGITVGFLLIFSGTFQFSQQSTGASFQPHFFSSTTSKPFLQLRPAGDGLPAWHATSMNPLSTHERLLQDEALSIEFISPHLQINQKHTIIFHCAHQNITEMCAKSYRVWFIGPTLVSPTFDTNRVLDERRVEVTFTIRDPGVYDLYAWPEHERCDQWNNQKSQYHKMAVRQSPYSIEITGTAEAEEFALCKHSESASEGSRWVSRAYIDPYHYNISSPHWWWLHTYSIPSTRLPRATVYSYLYLPYRCKRPHHTFREWIELLRPKYLLVFGDSVLRDLFCLLIYTSLDMPPEKQCTFNNTDIQGYHLSNKNITYVHSDGFISQLNFAWLPNADAIALEQYLLSQPIPSHIFFGVSLWLAKDPIEDYGSRLRPTLEVLSRLAPDAEIVARTSAGVVQAIQCYDRIGGQRDQMEGMNGELKKLLLDFPQIKLMDVYPIFNNFPSSSSDGRHWSSIGVQDMARPQVGFVELALADELFYSWLPV